MGHTILALVLAALQAGGPSALQEQPILIGLCARAGPEASWAERALLGGASLALAECNAGGGLLGRTVALLAAGAGDSARAARATAAELLARGVDGVVAPLAPEGRELVVKACRQAGLPVVVPDFEPGEQARVLVEALAGPFRCARVGWLADDSPDAQRLRAELAGRLAAPLHFVLEEGLDLKAKTLQRALEERRPQVLVLDGTPRAVAAALDGALRAVRIPLVLTLRSFGAELATVERELFLVQVRSAATSAAGREFVEAYRAQQGEPGCGSSEGYEATRLLLAAIERAGSCERADVRTALGQVRVRGPRGALACTPAGELALPAALWRWSAGAAQPYLPPAVPGEETLLLASGGAPDPKVGPPFGALRTEAFQLEPGTQWVRLHFGAPGKATIDADLARLGLSTHGASPLLDALVKEELLARALSILSAKYLRDALGRSIRGQSLRVSFAVDLPGGARESDAWDAEIAGDDARAGGRSWPGTGHCEVYATQLVHTVLPYALEPPLSAADLTLLDGSQPFGSAYARDRRSELIRALIQAYAGSIALTSAHEVGHLFGLAHTSDDPACIMSAAEESGIDPGRAHFSEGSLALLRKTPGVVP